MPEGKPAIDKQLERYRTMLVTWNARLNLVSRETITDLQHRHLEDSAFLATYAPQGASWSDMGSGGGLPGVVVAVVRPDVRMTLIESDQRKAAFLRAVRRELGISLDIIEHRIEAIEPRRADVISARALARLWDLLRYATHHGHAETICLFPKGATWRDEVVVAQEDWIFDFDAIPSATNAGSALLRIEKIKRRE